jgi:hypothetical protein
MRRLFLVLCSACLVGTVHADDAPFLLDSVEKKFTSDVAKAQAEVGRAEADLAKAKKAASAARLKAYQDRLTEVTKAADLDKAQAVKARIDELEKDPDSMRSLTEETTHRRFEAFSSLF